MSFRLLTRDEFRSAVFERDEYKCVVCKDPAKDAHHLIERRLFGDSQGYYIENGVSLCETHHIEAEQTTLSCSTLREFAGITKFPIPEHLYSDQSYDKWGNPILPNGMRLRGELFDDASVQKILSPVLSLFTDRVKYPRTYHLPWSEGVTKDDRIMDALHFDGEEVIVTAKMDGENTTLYCDYMHARSVDYSPHESRSMVKALHGRIAHDIPKGWRVCGENLYAKHSIKYENIDDYFLVFSVWDDKNTCLSWDETLVWAELLGLKTVPLLFEGLWNEKLIRCLYKPELNGDPMEGYVVRLRDAFSYREFRRCVGKMVRAGHVQTHGHWMRNAVEPNKLRVKN